MAHRKSKDASPEAVAAADAAVRAFWAGNGSDPSLRHAQSVLGGLGLSAAQVDQLRLELPAVSGAGTTSAKIRRMDSLLLRLHSSAA